MIGIYKITNTINGKVYIGQSQNIELRWNEHIKASGRGEKQVIYSAMRKYGVENFSFEVIEECSIEDLDEKEIYYIKEFNSYIHAENSNGYNMTLGGGGKRGYKATEETKRKMSISLKGRELTEEWKQNLSKSLKDRKLSEECKQKMSIVHQGITHTEETKKLISKIVKDRVNEEHIENFIKIVKETKSKKIICDGKLYNSLTECAKIFEVNKKTMSAWLNGQNKMRSDFVDMNLHYATEEEIRSFTDKTSI